MKSHLKLLSKNIVLIGARVAMVAVLPAIVLPLEAAVDVTLSTPESSLPVGSTFNLTANASDTANPHATFTYQFAVRQTTAPSYSVVKNFYKTNTFAWTPSTQEGIYYMHVIVNSSTGSTGDAYQTLIVKSLVTGSTPVVFPTRNPLVALYSAPPCASPYQVRVVWKAAADAGYRGTAFQPCNGHSLNFYIAGMRASTTYYLHQDTFNGSSFSAYGPVLPFTTGAITVSIPSHSLVNGTSMQPPTEYIYPNLLRLTFANPFTTDNAQNVIWYFSPVQGLGTGIIARPISGGTFLGMADEPTAVCPQTNKPCGDHQFFREYDLAGNVLRETNWTFLNQEVNVLRASDGKGPVHLSYFSHEGTRLPNGDTVTVVTDEETKDQGDGPADVLGDLVVVLDSNFQLKHQWDAFDYLDIKRKALLNDHCTSGGGGCPILYGKQANGQYYTQANDWTHVNSVFYDPKDENLVVSIRHQAWVIKTDYRNGAGDEHTVWTLGEGGDFALSTGDPLDWFSYQHDAEFQSNGALTLFDNGDFRVAEHGGGNSRGQAWSLDEVKHIATPILNVDLGVYSRAVGSAALLSNGNYTFCAGFIGSTYSQTSEVTPSGHLVYREQTNALTYRSFRLSSIYGPN